MTTKSITLDVWQSNDVRVKVNQGEIDSRFLQIKITDKSKAFDLADKTVIFYATKPDGNLIFNYCEIIFCDSNRRHYNLHEPIFNSRKFLLVDGFKFGFRNHRSCRILSSKSNNLYGRIRKTSASANNTLKDIGWTKLGVST